MKIDTIDGFDFVSNKPLGAGQHGTVFLMRNCGEYYAVKYSNSILNKMRYGNMSTDMRKLETKKAVEDDIIVSINMEIDFKNPMSSHLAFTSQGYPVVIKSFINGRVLKYYIESNKLFSGIEGIRMRQSLINLFLEMSRSYNFYGDLNSNNLIWNGSMWVVVDCKTPIKMLNKKLALYKNTKDFIHKLCINNGIFYYYRKKEIYKFFNRGIYIPRYTNRTFENTKTFCKQIHSLTFLHESEI